MLIKSLHYLALDLRIAGQVFSVIFPLAMAMAMAMTLTGSATIVIDVIAYCGTSR